MQKMLTKKQKKIYDFVTNFIEEKDYSPSLDEIGHHFKLAVSTIHEHIEGIKRKGFINKRKKHARTIETKIIQKNHLINIPILGTIAAGQPIEAIENKEFIALPRNGNLRDKKIFALRVAGNSMVDENIHDGDIVLVKEQSIAENGQKVVALVDNYGTTLKTLYKENDSIRLQPANKKFKPIIIKKGQDLLIQGVVIDVFKKYSKSTINLPKKRIIPKPNKSRIEDFINKVIEGDCLDVMRNLPEKSIDMILCDLPYGTTQNKWDSVIPLEQLWRHYERIIKDNGVIALTAQGFFSAQLISSNPKLFKYKIIWVKSKPTNFLNAKKQPLRKHEDVLIFYKNQPEYNPQMSAGEPYNKGFRKNQLTGSYGDFKTVEVKSDGKRYPTDVVYFKTAESEGPVYHPTQKPVDLGRYLIKTFTKTGDIILDNTCGSGSFLVSAILEQRKFIGIEKNKEVFLHKKHNVDYIEICNQRIEEAKLQLKNNKIQKELFQETIN